MKYGKETLGGVGLGLLTGLIIGLSISQVVGLILGVLTSILTTYLSFKRVEDEEHTESNYSKKLAFLGVFGLCSFLSILIGIYLRSHSTLSPSLKDEVTNLIEAGVRDTTLAVSIAVSEQKGIIIGGDKFLKKDTNSLSFYKSTALMSDEKSLPIICGNYDNLQMLASAFEMSGNKDLILILDNVQKNYQNRVEQYAELEKFKDCYCQYFAR